MASTALSRAKIELRNALHTEYEVEQKAEAYLMALREYRQSLGERVAIALRDEKCDWTPAWRGRRARTHSEGARHYLKMRLSA